MTADEQALCNVRILLAYAKSRDDLRIAEMILARVTKRLERARARDSVRVKLGVAS